MRDDEAIQYKKSQVHDERRPKLDTFKKFLSVSCMLNQTEGLFGQKHTSLHEDTHFQLFSDVRSNRPIGQVMLVL